MGEVLQVSALDSIVNVVGNTVEDSGAYFTITNSQT